MGDYQDATGQIVSYNSFWLSDTKYTGRKTILLLYVEASNIFNVHYYDFGGIVQPGRWFRTGLLLISIIQK